jgi:fructose-1,6-bisphosphatase/inositol monophosphatase family enzyme
MTIGSDGPFHDRVIATLREVGESTILPRFNRLSKAEVRSKTHAGDLVTIADEEAEVKLTEAFKILLPGSVVVGEEAVSRDRNILNHLNGDAPVWIVDPVDGTKNFVAGVGRFAMIVALVRDGETVMGWIHDPLAGETLIAERGAGTWRTKSSGVAERLRLPPAPTDLAEMITAHHHKNFGPYLGKFKRNVHLGSAAHDYWAAVDGRVHIVTYRRLRPWDHAAGVLIHTEAGGFNALLSGQPYRPVVDVESLLCAPTPEAWTKCAALAPDAANA